MPDRFKGLFNPNLLRSHCAGLKPHLGSRERAIVERWSRICADPRFRQQTENQTLTVRLGDIETAINDRVYHLFALIPAERQTLDDHMRHAMIDYPLGEV